MNWAANEDGKSRKRNIKVRYNKILKEKECKKEEMSFS